MLKSFHKIIIFGALVFILPACGSTPELQEPYAETGYTITKTEEVLPPPECVPPIPAQPPQLPCPTPAAVPPPQPPPQPENIAPAMPPFVPPQIQISEFGRQVAKEFLMQYVSIFSFGMEYADGLYQCWITGEVTPIRPLVLYSLVREGEPYLDRHGNAITDVPFIIGEMSANWFELLDLNNNGIPDIVITIGYPGICTITHRLYMFIDGRYVNVTPHDELYWWWWMSFYYDYSGQLIMFHSVEGYAAFYHAWVTCDGLDVEFLFHGQFCCCVQSFADTSDNIPAYDARGNPVRFGANMPHTRAPQPYGLREELTRSIRPQLYARWYAEQFPPYVPRRVEISEFGRQVAEEFLMQYVSIFSFGWKNADGTYFNWVTRETTSVRSLVTLVTGISGYGTESELWYMYYLDRLGNPIFDVPFICTYGVYVALTFELFDLNNNGIPDIVFGSGIPESCAFRQDIFMFIDGEYRNVTPAVLESWHFIYDYSGQLIVNVLGWGANVYYHAWVTSDGMDIELLFGYCCCNYPFTEIPTHDARGNPIRIGGHMPRTPVRPLACLQEELTQIITARLYAQYEN